MKILPLLAFALVCSLSFPQIVHAQGNIKTELTTLESEWARIKYQVATKPAKLMEIGKLEKKAEAVTANYADSAEAKIWEAIILATDANISKSLSALPKLEKAKGLLEQSLKMNPRAMEGSADMTLGSMYYQVPGWPIGFGDDKKAEEHLKRALSINPEGMDTNYWYGMFLIDQDRPEDALSYLEKASKVRERPQRYVADKGRLNEINVAKAEAKKMIAEKTKGNQ